VTRAVRGSIRTNKAARRYLLGGILVCSHCGERLVARPRSGGQRRYACAKGPGFAGCGKTYINADDVEGFVVEAVLHRLDSRELQRSQERRQRSAPEAKRWLEEIDATQAQQVELATAYGNREISMEELRAARMRERAYARDEATEAMRGLAAPAVNGLKHLLEPLLLRRRLTPPEDPVKETPPQSHGGPRYSAAAPGAVLAKSGKVVAAAWDFGRWCASFFLAPSTERE
jgi:Recombinase zinc beta ribbon domain